MSISKRTMLPIPLALTVLFLFIACSEQSNKDEVSSNNMPTASAAPTPKPTPPQAAIDAVKALRRMSGATEIGMNIAEYNRRLLDLNAEVDEALAQLPQGELSKETKAAMGAYVDALKVWGEFNSHAWCDCLNVKREPALTLQRKYSIHKRQGEVGNMFIDKGETLSTIWSAASRHVNRASSLIEMP